MRSVNTQCLFTSAWFVTRLSMFPVRTCAVAPKFHWPTPCHAHDGMLADTLCLTSDGCPFSGLPAPLCIAPSCWIAGRPAQSAHSQACVFVNVILGGHIGVPLKKDPFIFSLLWPCGVSTDAAGHCPNMWLKEHGQGPACLTSPMQAVM